MTFRCVCRLYRVLVSFVKLTGASMPTAIATHGEPVAVHLLYARSRCHVLRSKWHRPRQRRACQLTTAADELPIRDIMAIN